MSQSRLISVSLSDLIDYDFESCLDLFEEYFFTQNGEEAGILSNVTFVIAGVNTAKQIINLLVTGDIENLDEDEEEIDE